MSQDIDRDRVFETTRVRTLLKKDSSWIHSSDRTGKGRESTECPVEAKPTVTRQRSYVSSTAQKFESITLPLSPPSQKTRFKPSEGVSGYHAKTDVIPSPKDAQPEASTVEAADKIKPHVTTEELLTNGNAKVSLTNEKSKAVSLVRQNDQPKSNSTKEGLTEVSADVCVKDLVMETSAEAGTGQNNDASKGSVVPTGEQKPEERHSAETDPANVTSLQNTREESAMQTAKGACARNAPREDSETVAAEASDDTVVESVPETINVTNTAPEDEAVQQISAEQVPDLLADAVSKPPSQAADQTSAQGSSEEHPTAAGEAAKDEVKGMVTSANEISTVTSPTRKNGVPQTDSEEPISESPESAQGGSEGCPTGQLGAESAETETDVVVESSTDIPVVNDVGHEVAASCSDSEKPTSDLQENSASESPTPAPTESNFEQCFVVVAEPVEAVDDVEVESSPEIPAVTDVALEPVVLQDNVDPGPNLLSPCVSAPPAQFADETVTETVEAEAEVQFSPQTPIVNNTAPEKDTSPLSLADDVSHSSVEPSAEFNGVTNPSEVSAEEAEVVTEAVIESPTKETSCLDTDSQASTHPLSENCEKCPEPTEAAVEVEVQSEALQGCVEPGPESLAEACHSTQVAGESAEVATAVAAVVESSPDMPAVTDVAPQDVSSKCRVEPEPDSAEPVSESHTESSAQDSNEGCSAAHDGAESDVAISAVTDVAQTQEAFGETDIVKTAPNLQPNTEESESPTQPASVVEVVEALAEALVPSLPMTPENNTVPGEEGSVQNRVEPGPDPLPEPVEPAAEMSKEDCPSGEVSIESVKASAEGVAESSLETSMVTDAAQQDASDIQTEDALEPKVTSDSVKSKLAERAIELTDALDETPTTEAQCVKDSKQSSKGDSKVEQGPNATDITKTLEKPEENQGPAETQTRDDEVCSLCNQTFGIIRIRINHPPLILHPDCFKCGVCGKDLGDLLTPIHLLKEVIHCEACLA